MESASVSCYLAVEKPTNNKRIYAAEVARRWLAVKLSQSTQGNPMTERDLAQAVAEELEAGVQWASGAPVERGNNPAVLQPG
ncbi:MAG: hypothetical protein EBQ78_00370 [Betaproteobacteria bacterium]|nr:hypothetical protein [Betaproteobacteria bacterium]